MTVQQKSDPGSPDSTGSSTRSPDDHASNNAKLLLQKRVVVLWAFMVLFPLALIRVSLFYAFPERMSGDPMLSSELQQVLQTVNFSGYPTPQNRAEGDSPTTGSSVQGECNLLDGEWVPDQVEPAYSNDTCQHIQGHQNCLKNGRPDRGYLYWRWKPASCELPRFNTTLFMSLMKGKLLAFVGDSIARNHMQSLLCAISQIEKPIKTYTDQADRHVRWWFPSHNFTLSTFWSPYLTFQTDDESNGVAQGTSKLHLDVLDQVWLNNITEFDALILSSGQWFFKNNLYFVNNTVVGCHHCPGFNLTNLGFYYAYREIMQHVLKEISSHPGYKGVTMLRTFSPDHFEDGRWDNGGSCKRTVPFGSNHTIPTNSLTHEMHKIQVEVFNELASKESAPNGSKLRMVDITQLSYLRPDGHPGPYRNFQPFSKEFVGHVQNDCLHWCIPGPVDTWNDMILETLRREMQQQQ